MSEEVTKQFGEWLARQRHAKGLSMRETAKRIGIEPSYYCKIENGLRDDLRFSTVRKIDKVFPIGSFVIPLFSKFPIDKTVN